MGAGRTRFMRGPSLTSACETYRRSTSTSSLMFCALAMADCSTFSTVGAMRLLTVRSVVNAFPACWPRIMSTTRRAFCGETRIYLASALASISIPSNGRRLGRLPGFFRSRFYRVSFERAGRGKLAQLMPHHVLGDVHRNELLAVVHGDGVPHELGKNRGTARPGANDLLFIRRAEHHELGFQVRIGKRSLLYASSHAYLFLLFRFTIHLSVRLLLRVLKPRVG